ncbi:hypothetical protein ACFL10_00090 [Patescibacteria group bacterium]
MNEVLKAQVPTSRTEQIHNSKAVATLAAAILALTAAACEGKKPNTEEPKASTKRLPTKPNRVDVDKADTPIPLSNPQPMDKEFPMRRGSEVLKKLPDGTSIELANQNDGIAIYAIKDNRKIKFANLTDEQRKQVLEQQSFKDLQQLAITIADALEGYERKKSRIEGGKAEVSPERLRILFEGQIDACLDTRYRRVISFGNPMIGAECIWKERDILCAQTGSRRWAAGAMYGSYGLLSAETVPKDSTKGFPTAKLWLSKQPKCP